MYVYDLFKYMYIHIHNWVMSHPDAFEMIYKILNFLSAYDIEKIWEQPGGGGWCWRQGKLN